MAPLPPELSSSSPKLPFSDTDSWGVVIVPKSPELANGQTQSRASWPFSSLWVVPVALGLPEPSSNLFPVFLLPVQPPAPQDVIEDRPQLPICPLLVPCTVQMKPLRESPPLWLSCFRASLCSKGFPRSQGLPIKTGEPLPPRCGRHHPQEM